MAQLLLANLRYSDSKGWRLFLCTPLFFLLPSELKSEKAHITRNELIIN